MNSVMREVARSQIYRAEVDVGQLQRDVAQLREMDKRSETRMNVLLALTVTGVGLAVIGFVIGVAQQLDYRLLVGGIVVSGLIVTFALVLRHIIRRLNFENRRYELLSRIVTLLSKDMSADAVARVGLDLRPADHKTKLLRTGAVGPWKVSFYEDPWLNLQGRLLDGTAYLLEIRELTQHRSQWKKSASGKSKYKKKKKTATVALLRLKAKTTKYAHLEQVSNNVRTAVQLPAWCELKKATVSDGALMIKVSAKSDWEGACEGRARPRHDGLQMIAMMFLSLYQVLNRAKRGRSTSHEEMS